MSRPHRKNPNNFPREGQHRTVTRDAVQRLERARPRHNVKRHYTIGGTVEAVVYSTANAEREAAITYGARRLNHSSRAFRKSFEASRPDARTEYIRAQRQAARNHPARNVARAKSPSR